MPDRPVRPYRICILTSVHPLRDIRIFYKQARSLVRAGYEVTLIAPHDARGEFDLEGIRVVPLDRPKSRRERLTRTLVQAGKLALREQADLYHFHDPELMPIGALLRMKGHRVIYDIHENVAEQIRSKAWVPFPRLASRIYRILESLLCGRFSLVLAEASYDALYPGRFHKTVVQNFPELGLFPDPSKPEAESGSSSAGAGIGGGKGAGGPPRRIVYVGGVTRQRGISQTVEALGLLRRDGVDFRFDCIGEASPGYLDELMERCRALGIADRVVFHGRLIATDAYRIVAGSAVGLAVLQPEANYVDSYPTKIFEYMALRIPVIASDFPLYARTLQEARCGIAVDPANPQQLARAIRSLLEDPENARRMGENGRRAVESTYNWNVEEAKLLGLYRSLLAG